MSPSVSEQFGTLEVQAAGARIEVVDPWLRTVPGSGGRDRLELSVPRGAYRVTAHLAGSSNSEVVVVRPGMSSRVELPVRFDAAAPVAGTGTVNESHQGLASQLTSTPVRADARLVVILRGLRDREMAPLPSVPFALIRPFAGPQLPTERVPEGHLPVRAVGWRVDRESGGVLLRWELGHGRQVEHAVWLCNGWQTIVFVPQGPHGPYLPGMSIHMIRAGQAWDPNGPGALLLEAALADLRAGSTVEPPVERPYDNPMRTLVTYAARLRAGERDSRIFGVTELLWQMLGRHADVEALALAGVGHPMSKDEPLWPPMLAASLDLVLGSSLHAQVAGPGSVWEDVSGQRYGSSPWLLWNPVGLNLEGSALSGGFEHPPGVPGPSAPAVARVGNLLTDVAGVLKVSPAEAGARLGAAEIARRTGMTQDLVARCLAILT
ncbi:hypothetical protein [Actinoplanes sp. NPDC026670]|uniref:hypothetical protein n=1 Tax=Actinoplanes sp. NPDC026670 TaxID=3154700 RepID=UPI0033F4D2A5